MLKRIPDEKEGQNILEVLKFSFSIFRRFFPGNVENGHFDQKREEYHNKRELRTNKSRNPREKKSLIVKITHERALCRSR